MSSELADAGRTSATGARLLPVGMTTEQARLLVVDAAGVDDAVAALRLGPAGLARLADFLARTPDGLTSGSSDLPSEADRLISALRERHVLSAQPPRCLACGRERPLRHRVPGGRVCSACFSRANQAECSGCGQVRPVATRLPDGRALCSRCRALARAEPCHGCQRRLRVAHRDPEGRPFCQTCRPRQLERCCSCGEDRRVHKRTPLGPLCPACYRPEQRRCGRCGELRVVARRARDGHPDLCESCARSDPSVAVPTSPPTEVVDSDAPPDGRADVAAVALPVRGTRIAPLARPLRPPPTCAICDQTRPAQARWGIGPVCSTCYDQALAAPQRCPECGEPAALTGLLDRRRVCGPCGGDDRSYRCADCQQPCRAYAEGRCADCHLRHVLERLLPDGAWWTTLRETLCRAESGRAVLNWLRRGGAELLSQLACLGQPPSHELLDGLGPVKRVVFLRGVLTVAGLLEERPEHIARFERWVDQRTAELPREHSNLIRPFALWTLLRRARRRDERRGLTEGGAKWLRQRVNAAIDFLAFLDDHHEDLSGADQALLDLYLASGSSRRTVVRDFLAWAHQQGRCRSLTVPLRRTMSPPPPMHEDERWAVLRRLLHDDDIKVHLRIGGVLNLLYGQHLSRIVALTADQISRDRTGQVYVAFGRSRCRLLEPLGQLLLDLLGRDRGKAVVARSAEQTRWVFPGGTPGRHLTAEALRTDLAALGVTARPGRNAALAELAADVPAAVLASLLGLHINTAVSWTRSVQQDWQPFIAETRNAAAAASVADLNT